MKILSSILIILTINLLIIRSSNAEPMPNPFIDKLVADIVADAGEQIGNVAIGAGETVGAIGKAAGVDLLGNAANAILKEAGDLTKGSALLAGGIITTLPELITNPNDLFRLGTELLVGVPTNVFMSLFNAYCSAAIESKVVESKYTPELDKVKFELHTRNTKVSVPIAEAGSLFNNPNFNPNYKTVILATGFLTSANGAYPERDSVKEAYLCRGDYNFILVDTSSFLITLYSWAALNTQIIGNFVGLGVKNLIDTGYPLENIHLVGHSLGAQIVGSAGKYFNQITGKTINRITGLDPSKPCFNEGKNMNRLSRGDALFVDVIHTNPGGLGQQSSLGDADFYPNALYSTQPGCIDPNCSHNRAMLYYGESVYQRNERGLMSVRCNSYRALDGGYCTSQPVPMGFAALNNRGDYYLKTRSSSPFGLHSTDPKYITCKA